MHAWPPGSDAYDAPVNYRRASGNASDVEHIKSLIYYPVAETFYSNAILCICNNWHLTLLCIAEKCESLRNYHPFSRTLKCRRKKRGRVLQTFPNVSLKSREVKFITDRRKRSVIM